MPDGSDTHSWFDQAWLDPDAHAPDSRPQEFDRLWRGFMTARVTLGLVLLLLQGTILALGSSRDTTLILVCLGYLVSTLAFRFTARPRRLVRSISFSSIATIGVDIVAFAALQWLQGGNINYAPLFALPVLMASVLGSLLLALGAAAGATLLLLVGAAWTALQTHGDATAQFLQAALTGAGCFVISFLSHQIATRLAREELKVHRSELAVRVQRQVNALVIESLTDGVLVADRQGLVRAANPAARRLLGSEPALRASSFDLTAVVGWQALVDVMKQSFAGVQSTQHDVTLTHPGHGAQRVRVRTQLTGTQGENTESLCVMFLQDQREMEARLRTDKLASMGRLSAAVAHEIRNPLSAIAQANDLLDEDLTDARQKRLTQMIQQNTKRLEKIVEEVLDVSRVQNRVGTIASHRLMLNGAVERICRDWQQQTASDHLLRLTLTSGSTEVSFESEHLRRILVNLLDNAKRYASGQIDSVLVSTVTVEGMPPRLSVWSDGPPLEPSVERHLFEPFFSSESRSTGLGLYICRELCEGHGASISYRRARRKVRGTDMDGNEFIVTFGSAISKVDIALPTDQDDVKPWQPTHL